MKNPNLAIWLPPNHDPNSPSVRLRRINLRKPLRKAGIKADIVYRYEDLLEFDNILLMTFDAEIVNQCYNLRKKGKKLYFCHTEQLFGLDYQEQVFNLCDYIVCCSNKLAEVTKPHLKSSFTKITVIEDMLEGPRPLHEPVNREQLTVVYCGMGGNSYLSRIVQPVIEELGMKLIVISEHADADIPWNRDTYLYEMAKCDIVICPQNVALQPAKSHVKVATAMGLGMPFICSPSHAYLEIVQHGVNGFIASTLDEWKQALITLKDFQTRKKIAVESKRSAVPFEPETIAAKWKSLLTEKRTKVAFINNTLPTKYMSYGDSVLEELRLLAYDVEVFRYEDVDILPPDFDFYVFVEVRYDPNLITNHGPKILLTRELYNPNLLTNFDYIITDQTENAQTLRRRGFTNTALSQLTDLHLLSKIDLSERRKEHNFDIHTRNTNNLRFLHLPEERWNGSNRDKAHIKFVNEHLINSDSVLDVGSADGWLSLYCASQGMKVSCLDFVERGLAWTAEQAKRLNLNLDIRSGHTEDAVKIFSDKIGTFDAILLFEILEHVDYTRLNWYLDQLETLLKPGGRVLISLPKQDMIHNLEHMWSPTQELIDRALGHKLGYKCEWVPIANHEIEGNWFISFNKVFTKLGL